MFQYRYPHPAVATDVVVFDVRDVLSVLLIERRGPPFAGAWAIPGGFLEPDEDLDACARRELKEETGLAPAFLRPFGTFSAPDRDPRERVISAAYYALLGFGPTMATAGDDAARAQWWPAERPPKLAFDHREILAAALSAFRKDLVSEGALLVMAPELFRISRLQTIAEDVTGARPDRRALRHALIAGRMIEAEPDRPGLYRRGPAAPPLRAPRPGPAA